jgi:hypothetical protein
MQEQLISFETAKLAKEKGFNVACNTGYHPDDGNLLSGNMWKSILRYKSDRHTYAPTQSLLQKWLRDVHDVHIEIPSLSLSEKSFDYIVINSERKRLFESSVYSYDTYEEALEAALIKALIVIAHRENESTPNS